MPFPKEPPPGFRGLQPGRPVQIYRRNLPHLRQEGGTYFTTFHLNDALPQQAIRALKAKRSDFTRSHPSPIDDEKLIELARQLAVEEERWLDQGMGSCPYRGKVIRDELGEIMHKFDSANTTRKLPARYDLHAWVMMPNHVHVIMTTLAGRDNALELTLGRWKQQSSQRLNKREGQQGSRWFQESYDRLVRDSEELWRCLQYIGRNGKKAQLSCNEYDRWVSPDWLAQGWAFDS